MKSLHFILLFLALSFFSCSQDSKSGSQTPAPLTAKEYVENNTYIDVADFGEDITPDKRNDPARLAQTKAAIYRFFSHVTVVDNQYVCDLTSAEQINVSKAMYNKMMNNLKETNANIRESEAQGHRVELGPLGEEYLNSLLEENSLLDHMRIEANKGK